MESPCDTLGRMGTARWLLIATTVLAAACADPQPQLPLPEAPGPLPDPQMPADADAGGRVVHAMKPLALQGAQETMTCYSWTVDNDAPLYVGDVTFQNEGSFHHSNWFVVPEDVYPGEDGFWPCADRDFNDISAALTGTVLFAQSTQAQRETMGFADGAAIRIPERSKIVAGVHLLNLSPDPRQTAGWISLEVMHPGLVESVLSPVMLSYRALSIPPRSIARFNAGCVSADLPWDLELHYLLPHYHRTGIEAKVSLFENGEETVALEHAGFGPSPMGKTFDPPLAFDHLSGIEFSCGYDNPHDETLSWGIGINEMCVFLAFVRANGVFIAGVAEGSSPIELEDGSYVASGACDTVTVPKGRAYDPPTREEIEGPLVLPPSADDPVPDPPTCVDIPGTTEEALPPTFAQVQSRVLDPSCSFSSCHGSGAAAGLDLRGEQARDALVDAASTATDLPRVAPGDPEGSYLYRLLSQCEPTADGVIVRHMPAGAPTLLDAERVGLVRAWIEAGAP